MKKRKELEKRFKLLYFLASSMDIWEDVLQGLSAAIDENHPQAEEMLAYHEDCIIAVLEAEKDEDIVLPKKPVLT